MENFKKVFSGKRVLVLGHTGFKGSWLTIWLNKLGANEFLSDIEGRKAFLFPEMLHPKRIPPEANPNTFTKFLLLKF